jgi:hypothetical protein
MLARRRGFPAELCVMIVAGVIDFQKERMEYMAHFPWKQSRETV